MMLSRSFLAAGAFALVALTASGCDSNDSSSLLSAPSSSDRSDIADALDANFGAGCNASVASLTGSDDGTLEDGDCTLGDDSFADFYAFTLEEDADVEVEMESDDFPPYLLLFEVDIDADGATLTPLGEFSSDGDDNVRFEDALDSGTYVVAANSVTDGLEGDYTITVDADDNSSDDDDRPAPVASSPKAHAAQN